MLIIPLLLINPFVQSTAHASEPGCAMHFPKVSADLAQYDATLLRMRSEQDPAPAHPTDVEWVKNKLQFMFEIDQYLRSFQQITPIKNSYSEEERKCFFTEFSPRWESLDSGNTNVLKELLNNHDWIRISLFGDKADDQAWLIAQHADREPEFQKLVLGRLEKLYPLKETKPSHYAYLFDRVAASWNDETKRKPQRFGTQGMCKGPDDWQPIEIENPEELDTRRAAVGLSTFAEYKKQVDGYCQ